MPIAPKHCRGTASLAWQSAGPWASAKASSAGAQGRGRRSEPRRVALDDEGDYMIPFVNETTVNETRVSVNAVV